MSSAIHALYDGQPPLPGGSRLQAMASEVLRHWQATDDVPGMNVEYNTRLRTTGGRAVLNTNSVELNPRLLGENPDQFLTVLVHELAHLVVYARNPYASDHGLEFRMLMKHAGLDPRATHQMDTAQVRGTRFLYLHHCPSCQYSFIVRSVRRRAICPTCRSVQWDVYRAEASQDGAAALRSKQHSL
jgi:predicted SprT family Zn-dependent metalloprotease